MPPDQHWNNLNAAQADGQACVICDRSFRTRGSVCLLVGRSHTGSQVFACEGACAQTATAPGAVLIPAGALTAARAAFLPVLEAVGGELPPDGDEELVTAAVHAAAPLIVAAALRQLATEMDPATGPRETPTVSAQRARELWAIHLRVRADELDPAGGGERR